MLLVMMISYSCSSVIPTVMALVGATISVTMFGATAMMTLAAMLLGPTSWF
ncbi:hypothetical protein [Sphingomonas psychrolutea]|uniref:hypothetical protein n=1 Tax=Sphingomonas psychrolutea TaxID=1259676 RepID=UPI001665D63A|nr:hypothetical protein [Sphingomonas psychrolutea]